MIERQDHDGEAEEQGDGSDDCFAPPKDPCECFCLHCRRIFMSTEIWFQRVIGDPHLDGFWMCPTPNCSGAGFTFDIFPTDPDHPANAGWHEADEAEYDDDEDNFEEVLGPEEQSAAGAGEWDPAERAYRELDDGDIEGEEWKHGLGPGEPLPASEPSESPRRAREEMEEEERRYDMPDERPRVLDWTDRQRHDDSADGGGEFNVDDIPF